MFFTQNDSTHEQEATLAYVLLEESVQSMKHF